MHLIGACLVSYIYSPLIIRVDRILSTIMNRPRPKLRSIIFNRKTTKFAYVIDSKW